MSLTTCAFARSNAATTALNRFSDAGTEASLTKLVTRAARRESTRLACTWTWTTGAAPGGCCVCARRDHFESSQLHVEQEFRRHASRGCHDAPAELSRGCQRADEVLLQHLRGGFGPACSGVIIETIARGVHGDAIRVDRCRRTRTSDRDGEPGGAMTLRWPRGPSSWRHRDGRYPEPRRRISAGFPRTLPAAVPVRKRMPATGPAE